VKHRGSEHTFTKRGREKEQRKKKALADSPRLVSYLTNNQRKKQRREGQKYEAC
jgi:hypothetical protein